MIELKTIEADANGDVALTCPIGKRNRVVSITANVTPASIGDQLIIRYIRSNQVLAGAAVQLLAVTDFASASLSTQQPPPLGIAAYAADGTSACGSLPDVWWPFDLRIDVSITNGTALQVVVVYEQQPA